MSDGAVPETQESLSSFAFVNDNGSLEQQQRQIGSPESSGGGESDVQSLISDLGKMLSGTAEDSQTVLPIDSRDGGHELEVSVESPDTREIPGDSLCANSPHVDEQETSEESGLELQEPAEPNMQGLTESVVPEPEDPKSDSQEQASVADDPKPEQPQEQSPNVEVVEDLKTEHLQEQAPVVEIVEDPKTKHQPEQSPVVEILEDPKTEHLHEQAPLVEDPRPEHLQEEDAVVEDPRPEHLQWQRPVVEEPDLLHDQAQRFSRPEQLPDELEELRDAPDHAQDFMDILGNGELLKKTLIRGSGQATRPRADCRVTINYEARLGDAGDVVDRQDGLTITVGDCCLVQALDMALMLTELGERCHVVSGPQFAYGVKRPHTTQTGGLIPAGSTLNYTLDLVSVAEPLDLTAAPLEARLSLADEKRERGNFWFNREDYITAVACYARAAGVLERHCSDGGDMSGAANSTLQAALDARVRVYNNLAACQLKLEAWDAVVESCDKALRLQPSNAKALYRKGRAMSCKGDNAGALKVLRAALAEDPDSRALQNEVARLTLECKRQQTASQELYRRMMGVKSPAEASASASSSTASSPASSRAAAAQSTTFFARHKYWWLAGAAGSLLVSAILAGTAYRNSR